MATCNLVLFSSGPYLSLEKPFTMPALTAQAIAFLTFALQPEISLKVTDFICACVTVGEPAARWNMIAIESRVMLSSGLNVPSE